MNPKSLKVLAVTLFFIAGLSLSQRSAMADVVMQLTGSNQGYNMGGVYTSPYQITVTVNGVPTPLLLACDDFETDINFGDKWLANVNHLMDVAPGGPQKFDGLNGVLPSDPVKFPDGTTASYTIEQRYDAAAWLADQLISDPSILNNQMQSGYYSYAIWQIFESKAYEGWGGTAANPNLSPDQLTHVQDAMKAAFAAVTNVKTGPQTISSLDARVKIYTPIPPAKGQAGYIYPSQEFIGVSVPEGSSVAILFSDYFIALLGIILVRCRILRQV